MLSTAFTFGSILLAIIALAVGFAWGKIIAATAKEEAQKAAKERADDYIQEWLSKEAPAIIRSRVDFILDATLGDGDDAEAADEIGKGA
jgi:D-arabinose 1-dehydrogenase-like Zn-dependent alcohol dehydrogenase